MPIMEGPAGTQEDTAAMVWDLVDGFALLSAAVAEQYKGPQSRPLEAVLCRLADRVEAIGKKNLAARLNNARGRFASSLS
ncbi:hypothetical protein [Sphingomonas endolithica]|uniref:hypothetical protein n=1 Tax=Sphingomonas endolithica TaxID=2972485 RepID=UPI0021AE7851|nr:hypothetical protein [Sphingomonas sp. ZFBP2030]